MAKYVDENNLARFWDNIQDQIGSASQEQVDAWLMAHPEATTTVQDNSVTDAKLVQTGGILSRTSVYERTSDNYDFGFRFGTVIGGTFGAATERIRSLFIPVSKGDYFTVGDAGNILALHMWDKSGSYSQVTPAWTNQAVVPSDGYAIVLLRKVTNQDISASEIEGIASNLRLIANGVCFTNETSALLSHNALLGLIRWDIQRFNFSNGNWDITISTIGMQSVVTALTDITITIDDGYRYAYGLFSGTTPAVADLIYMSGWLTGEATIPAGSNFLMNVSTADNTAASYPTLINHVRFNPFKALESKVATTDATSDVTWTHGVISADGSIGTGNWVTSDIIQYPSKITVNPDANGMVMRLYSGYTYLGKLNANNELDKIAGNWKMFSAGTVDVAAIIRSFDATAVQVSVQASNGTTITDENAQEMGDVYCEVATSLYLPVEFADVADNAESSVVGTDFIRRKLKVTKLGTLTNMQAFCIYNGKYYSTNGAELTVQDSSFNVERTAELNLGHGNSMQLGSDGKAYVSGWNDDKVHVVDLATLTIDSTIDLAPIGNPTLGYTTAAIDDVNGIAYIFQRDSNPSTVAMYNLITYDYVNDSVVSTRKVKAFAAMQACDYYEGRILVAYGMGTSAAPSGMFVCNTAGDILAEYDLDIFAASEPEGVCFDRSTGNLLVSKLTTNVGNQVYKIEQA